MSLHVSILEYHSWQIVGLIFHLCFPECRCQYGSNTFCSLWLRELGSLQSYCTCKSV